MPFPTEILVYANELECKRLRDYLAQHSNLPGARCNLNLMHQFADALVPLAKNADLFDFLMNLWNLPSNGNDAETLPVLCGLLGLSYFYQIDDYKTSVSEVFIEAMNDARWRVREVIQESLKIIAHQDWVQFTCFIDSITKPSMLEWRAIITTLAHPEILKCEAQSLFSLGKLKDALKFFEETICTHDLKNDEFIALNKGMCFAPSVIVAAKPVPGLLLLEGYIGHSKVMNRMLKSNLKKNRLVRLAGGECARLIELIDAS